MNIRSLARGSRAAFVLTLGLLAACEIPSEAPILQQTWVVPGDSLRVGVADFLPSGVGVNGAGTAFTATTPAANFSTTLGAVCGQPACQSGATVSAPVPAFTSAPGVLSTSISLPAGVASANITGGQLTLVVTNALGFDPLRPNGAGTAPFGELTVTIATTAQSFNTTFNGATQALPNGAATDLVITLPAISYSAPLTISVAMTVPAGASASLNANNSLAVLATLSDLAISSASVTVSNESINTAPTEFDLEGVDFGDQLESGELGLEVYNPFTVTASLALTLTAPMQNGAGAVAIVKNVNIPAMATGTAIAVPFSQSELRSLLGKEDVRISITGVANTASPGDPVSVSPQSVLVLRTRVLLVLNVGA